MPFGIIVLLVLAVIGGAVAFVATRPTDSAPTEEPSLTITEPTPADLEVYTPPTENPPTDETVTGETPAAGSTYNANASYLTPRRTEQSIAVALTVANGVITGSNIIYDGKPEGETSNDYQANFDKAYEAVVIGQPVAGLSLSRIGGASLTTEAFNEAVAQIATEAGA